MIDYIRNAADEISGIQVGTGYESVTIGITAALEAARALADAGLLVSPEHDAAVAAKALREAAEEVYGDDRAAGPYSHPLSAASWLRERADRIEREAGESDADA